MAAASSSASSGGGPALMFLKSENEVVVEELRKRMDPERAPHAGSLSTETRISEFDGEFLMSIYQSATLMEH